MCCEEEKCVVMLRQKSNEWMLEELAIAGNFL
jgi:hypothetical protein